MEFIRGPVDEFDGGLICIEFVPDVSTCIEFCTSRECLKFIEREVSSFFSMIEFQWSSFVGNLRSFVGVSCI